MDDHVGVGQKVLDGVLEVFIKAALFRVEHDVLVDDGEETLVIRLLPLGVGVVGEGLLFAAQVVQLGQGFFALLQGFVVDVLFGVDDDVQQELLQNGEQIGEDPVQPYAGGDEEAQEKGDAHRQDGGAQLTGHALLRLEGVHLVLAQAEGEGGQTGQNGHQQGGAAGGDGHVAQIQAEQVQV